MGGRHYKGGRKTIKHLKSGKAEGTDGVESKQFSTSIFALLKFVNSL